MSLLRSPNGGGITNEGLGGSQPNLSDIHSDMNLRHTHRTKRKFTDDDYLVRTEFFELRKQMSEMMTLLKANNSSQVENINSLRQDVADIKSEVSNISNTIETIITENKNLKEKIKTLTRHTENIEKKVTFLETDVNNLKCASPVTPAQLSQTCEEIIYEIQNRNTRAKNIIVVGIPEPKASTAIERQDHDKAEIQKIIKSILGQHQQPEKITRLGKYNSANTRAVKVCFSSEELVKSILRNRNKTGMENIKIYSDQTPKQRKHMMNLKDELQKRTANGERNLTIKFIKGMPKITTFNQNSLDTEKAITKNLTISQTE